MNNQPDFAEIEATCDPLLFRGIVFALLIEGGALFLAAVFFGFCCFAGGRL